LYDLEKDNHASFSLNNSICISLYYTCANACNYTDNDSGAKPWSLAGRVGLQRLKQSDKDPGK
jgi:hypothetical protein